MTQYRKDKLENDFYYHVFNRSIAKFIVFNNEEEFSRFLEIFDLYRHVDFNYQYSKFIRLDHVKQSQIIKNLKSDNNVLVEIIAFCIMPTHVHFLLKQVSDQGISKFMGKILNCYSKHFNIKHNRIGPLWAGRFKSVLVENDNQLLHLTRYIHLNPTSANLVKSPSDWYYSSFLEYLDDQGDEEHLCNKDGLFDLTNREYEKFVNDHKSYQRELSIIKSLLIDEYSG